MVRADFVNHRVNLSRSRSLQNYAARLVTRDCILDEFERPGAPIDSFYVDNFSLPEPVSHALLEGYPSASPHSLIIAQVGPRLLCEEAGGVSVRVPAV
jgi:hypothetical protein